LKVATRTQEMQGSSSQPEAVTLSFWLARFGFHLLGVTF
jgi:hypothetical protein